MNMLRKTKMSVSLLACVTILVSAQSFALAQNGAMYGYTATDIDTPCRGGKRVYRIDLTNPDATIAMGLTNVNHELEGFFSIDGPVTSRLFGVSENPDITSCVFDSVVVDLTAAACSSSGLGVLVGPNGISFGTEVGAAWDHTTGIAYVVATDEMNTAVGEIRFADGTEVPEDLGGFDIPWRPLACN
jgi:hypothetical protein